MAFQGCIVSCGEPPREITELARRDHRNVTVYQVGNRLTLAIPIDFQRAPIEGHSDIAHPAQVDWVAFDYFLPDFSGYAGKGPNTDFDSNKVEVTYLTPASPAAMEPDAPGNYVPNAKKRLLAWVLDPNSLVNQYGLSCYRVKAPTAMIFCFDDAEQIVLKYFLPDDSAHKFPHVVAEYFSPAYGGMEIAWRTPLRNLPRWKEIDQKIWALIGEWKQPGAKPGAG
jgi:hypothetical protein